MLSIFTHKAQAGKAQAIGKVWLLSNKLMQDPRACHTGHALYNVPTSEILKVTLK